MVTKAQTAQSRIVRDSDSFDKRDRSIAPIAIKEVDITIDISDNDQYAVYNLTLNGEVQQIVFEVPQMESNGTAELLVLGPRGGEWFASGEKAEATVHVITSSLPPVVAGQMTLKVEASEAQTADRNFKAIIYYE